MFKFTKSIFIVALLLNTLIVAAEELQVATSEWIPYVGKDLPNQGLALDIVNQALKRAGYTTSMNLQSWSRTLEGTDIGVFDLIATAWYSKERDKSFYFSKPYIYSEITLLKHIDFDFRFSSIADLNGRTVGIIRDYAYGEKFDRARGIIRVPGIHILENIQRVLNGEIELTVGDKRVLQYEIKHNISLNRDKLIFVPNAVLKKGIYIAVSRLNPKHKEIAQAFDKAISAMRKDGTYDRIIKSHKL